MNHVFASVIVHALVGQVARSTFSECHVTAKASHCVHGIVMLPFSRVRGRNSSRFLAGSFVFASHSLPLPIRRDHVESMSSCRSRTPLCIFERGKWMQCQCTRVASYRSKALVVSTNFLPFNICSMKSSRDPRPRYPTSYQRLAMTFTTTNICRLTATVMFGLKDVLRSRAKTSLTFEAS